jgi:serine/threonine protein kinase
MPPAIVHAYPRTGEVLEGKYTVERLIGEGAMGAVFQATHVLRQAPVALKFMSPGIIELPGVVERFLNEGVAASRINNEHVVHVLDVSTLPTGLPYLVMEYLQGENLEELLSREGEPGLPDVERAVFFVLQVLRALQVAHRSGIVHRDLKPANCFVIRKDDDPDFIKILDFGISKIQPVGQPGSTQVGPGGQAPLNLTGIGAALGTPLYVSPEQARNPKNVDSRSDLYSVAVMLYELLTGKTPFEPESGVLSELFMLLATATPVPVDQLRHDLPPGLSAVVNKGLEKSPDARFQSAAEMAEALAPFADRRSEVVIRQLLSRPSMMSRRGSTPAPPLNSGAPGPSSARPSASATRRWSSEPAPVVSAPPQAAATSQSPVARLEPKAALGVNAGTAPGVGSADSSGETRAPAAPASRGRALWMGSAALAAAVLAGIWFLLPEQTPPSRIGNARGAREAATGTAASGTRGEKVAPSAPPLPKSPEARTSAASSADAGAPQVAAPDGTLLPNGTLPDTKPGTGAGKPGTTAAGTSGEGKVPAAPGKLRLRDIGRDRTGGR